MSTIADYLINDDYRPSNPKPHLQQYDNYQIYDLYCEDILNSFNGAIANQIQNKSFTAVQKFSPHGNILCDFRALAILYP